MMAAVLLVFLLAAVLLMDVITSVESPAAR